MLASVCMLALAVSVFVTMFVPGRGDSPALISPPSVGSSNSAPSDSTGGETLDKKRAIELKGVPPGSEPGRSASSSGHTDRSNVPGHELNPRSTGVTTSPAPKPVPTTTSTPQQSPAIHESTPDPILEPAPTEEEQAPTATSTPQQPPPVKKIPEPEPNNGD